MERTDASIRNLILDMDGVLWHGETPVPGLRQFFGQLRRSGFGFILATNNARNVAAQYSDKLNGFGVSVPPEQILTSAETTALYLSAAYPRGATVYVVGDTGLRLAITAHGFKLLPDEGFVGANARADVVVAGFTPHFCYEQLASATYLINQGAQFVGTNPDITFPTEYGPLPGAGSMLSFLETATGVPPLVLGKPGKPIFEEALRLLSGTTKDTVMVGDRLGTDIAGGHAAGMRTILLLSGISRLEDVDSSQVKPDWILNDLQALTEFIRKQDGQNSST
ncbi:MAG: HAD-IIA family hydrolase [Chloroflexota bacterium]|nr:MAG: HAD-IIA family hydrolase [Chloroflexota bacterium]